MANDAQLTPMMAQYRRIKGELPKDALLLFRLGDFYEMFFEDAQVGAQILNVALTKRGVVPMCGIPFHAANGYVARLLSRNGVVVIAAAISPYREVRDEVRRAHEAVFLEVFVDCPLDELIRRDRKGLYAKALRGEVRNFTGVSDPYEPPLAPDVTVRTDREQVDESVAKILALLEHRALIARP